MAICDDRCILVRSSWVRYIILVNGELAVQFYDRRRRRPDVCCLYPGTNCTWFLLGAAWPSKGKFVHAFLYRRRPYRIIRPPCPIAACNFDVSANTAHGTDTFDVDDTWVCPVGVATVKVECWGSGGGGQGSLTINADGTNGAGGGGGAYSADRPGVVAGDTYTITVGIGGTSNPAVDGADTSFEDNAANVLVMAKGGRKGSPGAGDRAGGLAADGIGCVRYSGGMGSGANIASTIGGGGGSSAGSGGNGGAGEVGTSGGAGGEAPVGGADGGDGGDAAVAAGDGNAPGAGGGGRIGNVTGGAGAAGRVTLTW